MVTDEEDPVEACYQTIRLYTCADREEVDRLILSDDLTAAYGLQEGEGKLPWTEVAEEHASLEKEIREAYANKELSAAQAQRLINSLP